MLIKEILLSNKNKILIVAITSITLIFFYFLFFSNNYQKDVDFFILEDNKNTETIEEDNIENVIDSNIYEEDEEEEDNLKDLLKEDKEIKNKNDKNYEEYIINLYQKINNLEKSLQNLENIIEELKKAQFSQSISQTPSKISILLTELYRIQHLALNGKDFSLKANQTAKIGKNIIGLNNLLREIADLKKLASKKELLEQIDILENNFYKKKHQKNLDNKKLNFKEKLKISLFNYFSVKKIKNFDKKDIFRKNLYQLKNNISFGDYKNAKINIDFLSKNFVIDKNLLTNIDNHYKFNQYFSEIINLILK